MKGFVHPLMGSVRGHESPMAQAARLRDELSALKRKRQKQGLRVVNFHAAQALVNYADSRVPSGALPWGNNLTAYEVRCKLLELRTDRDWVSVTLFNDWLLNQRSRKMIVCNRGINRLKGYMLAAAQSIPKERYGEIPR